MPTAYTLGWHKRFNGDDVHRTALPVEDGTLVPLRTRIHPSLDKPTTRDKWEEKSHLYSPVHNCLKFSAVLVGWEKLSICFKRSEGHTWVQYR